MDGAGFYQEGPTKPIWHCQSINRSRGITLGKEYAKCPRKKLQSNMHRANLQQNRRLAMSRPMVIARAFRGEPLLRTVIGVEGTLVYIANPAILDKSESDRAEGVGFPLEDVFVYDKLAFSALKKEWNKRHATPKSLWEKLIRYRPAD